MVNAQDYLDKNYPKETRKEIKELDLNSKDLEGLLDISDFTNLEELIIAFNCIEELNIEICSNLKILRCQSNLLKNLDLSNNLKLEELNIIDNNFTKQDLSFISQLVNLEHLSLGNGKDDSYWNKNSQLAINFGYYNKFYGSLELLKNMSKMISLSINNTDLDSGLEYLPGSIENFECVAVERSESKVGTIEQQLKKHGKPFKNWNFTLLLKTWKENNQQLINKVEIHS